MHFRLYSIVLILLVFSSCNSGLIPCPKLKVDKARKYSFARKMKIRDRNFSASAREVERLERHQKVSTYSHTPEVKPMLEHVDVQKWDCPKPGVKRTIPKALKDNIRKNKKAYENYYRSRGDSTETSSKGLTPRR